MDNGIRDVILLNSLSWGGKCFFWAWCLHTIWVLDNSKIDLRSWLLFTNFWLKIVNGDKVFETKKIFLLWTRFPFCWYLRRTSKPFITPFIAYSLTLPPIFLKLYYQHLLLQYDQYINTLILVTHSQSTESNISDYSGLKRDTNN